jgi:hypothetical protein
MLARPDLNAMSRGDAADHRSSCFESPPAALPPAAQNDPIAPPGFCRPSSIASTSA